MLTGPRIRPLARSALSLSAALLAGVFVLAACGDDDDPAGGGTPSGNLTDPDVFESAVRAQWVDGAEGVIDGFQRLIVAINGGAQDGVTIVPSGSGFSASVAVDLDGNGSRESTIAGALAGDVTTGATVSVSAVSVPDIPSLLVGGSGTVTQTGPTTFLGNSIGGGATVDPGGSGNAADVSVIDGAISFNLGTGTPNGFADAVISSEGENLIVEVSFEDQGGGAFITRFSGDGFDFTVP